MYESPLHHVGPKLNLFLVEPLKEFNLFGLIDGQKIRNNDLFKKSPRQNLRSQDRPKYGTKLQEHTCQRDKIAVVEDD